LPFFNFSPHRDKGILKTRQRVFNNQILFAGWQFDCVPVGGGEGFFRCFVLFAASVSGNPPDIGRLVQACVGRTTP
jgi:hypothetical protein